ncbi:type III restriction-modification system endonuclease [Rhizobium sp. GR12]|uniref:type III restriction-modification system endonuclease n=1 Tax=Rhizobium sp. GR12 TaxID=3053925 RepID=UPI002FBEE42A
MKLHFESDLDYQKAAIEAVCQLFRGQETNRTEFTVTRRSSGGVQGELGLVENALGIGNRLTLLDEEIMSNLKDIQLRNGLPPSGSLTSGDFTVEMETGTGKTYVYLRSVFELNKRFGFTKFVIVVPSVAIKEGVNKTLQITEDHFKALYSGQPYDYFLYDSSKLGQVRNFATSPTIQIMVVTVGAINKQEVNNLYKDSEKTGGEAPIDLIRATRPIIIVDEPQSVDGGLQGRGKQALDAMNPLCTLRYSATHVNKHHMVYRLDAVDAYDRKLVKQIEVASLEVEGGHNKAYLRFLSARNVKGTISARVEVDVQRSGRVQREEITVHDGDNLEEETGRAIYKDCRIGEIRLAGSSSFLEVRTAGSEAFLEPGQAIGDVDADAIKRLMIRRTIQEHLEKEKRLAPLGIKVLSLFFIDTVEHYRSYDADGNAVKGKYATIFEEEYRRAAKLPEFVSLFKEVDVISDAQEVHDGYFSIDKNKRWTDTAENNQANRDSAERAYNLIMKEKEKLLSFDTKLKFIFSHSALKEGWDNPNVFQICALREMGTERERRQTIGRGLRLCVNQQGERLRGFEVNTLTVVATESYESFAENLQKEIEADTGIRFGIVEEHVFANIPMVTDNPLQGPGMEEEGVTYDAGVPEVLGYERSSDIHRHLRALDLIDRQGKVQDSLRTAIKTGTFALPAGLEPYLSAVTGILRKVAGRLEVKNADERKSVAIRKEVFHSEEFRALWDRIKHTTTYRVQFDNEKLIADCARNIASGPPIAKARVTVRKADLAIGQGGVLARETSTSGPIAIEEGDIVLPDLLTDLQDRTQLTRRSLVTILIESGRLSDFKRNPQAFIELAADIINRTKRLALVDGIKYQRIGDQDFYAQELFEREELTGYLKNMLTNTKKSVYEHVIHDSAGVERTFAEQMEKNDAVKVYAKLPGWFNIPTPLGTYNPDWAVLLEVDGRERLYFVVETKASLFTDDLRDQEAAKIACGEAHFQALVRDNNPAKYVQATKLEDVFDHV